MGAMTMRFFSVRFPIETGCVSFIRFPPLSLCPQRAEDLSVSQAQGLYAPYAVITFYKIIYINAILISGIVILIGVVVIETGEYAGCFLHR